jgi:hypothetical protein
MFIVYGGSVTRESCLVFLELTIILTGVFMVARNGDVAFDLKLTIDKNVNDVIKPSWIKDSIALGEPTPFHHKYVYLSYPMRLKKQGC